jgi:xanthine dehydrogenase accessory factor
MVDDVLELACEMRRAGRPLVLATVVRRRAPSSGRPGSRAVIDAQGCLHGWVGGACAGPAVVREALRALREGSPRLLVLGTGWGAQDEGDGELVALPMTCQSEGALEVFLEPMLPRPHLVVIGGSPAVATLAGMAEVLGWRTAVVAGDGGPEAAPPGMPGGVVVPSFDRVAAEVSERTFVVVATQGHDDEESLRRALETPAAYVGLVASRRRAESVVAVLRDRGVPEAALARVHAPAGLDLGRVSHQEIAVAILAELVQLRAAGVEGPAQALPPRGEAVDPVCGMTVDVATARHRIIHHGQEYLFCAAGCRARFEADPARYSGALP